MFYMFYTAAGEADTGSQFSGMTVGFTKRNGMNYRRCNARDIFKLSDLSGTRVDITGYIDLEINTVSGENYHWTRMLVREGEVSDLIVGRIDLRMLDIIGENFPMKMTETAANLERKARANTLIEMEDEEDMQTESNYQSMSTKVRQAPPDNMEEVEEIKRKADEEAMDDTEPVNHHWHGEKIVWDQAAELTAEEEFRGMRKERDNALLLWQLGNGPAGCSVPLNIDMGNNNKKRADA